jgi:hypothetical protein
VVTTVGTLYGPLPYAYILVVVLVNATDVKISGGGLVDSDYQLALFHFHWGISSSSGSEHTLNGKHGLLQWEHYMVPSVKEIHKNYIPQFEI